MSNILLVAGLCVEDSTVYRCQRGAGVPAVIVGSVMVEA